MLSGFVVVGKRISVDTDCYGVNIIYANAKSSVFTEQYDQRGNSTE